MFLSSGSSPNVNASSPIGVSQRALQYMKNEYYAPQYLKGQYTIPFFIERPALRLLTQPSFSPSLCAGFIRLFFIASSSSTGPGDVIGIQNSCMRLCWTSGVLFFHESDVHVV